MRARRARADFLKHLFPKVFELTWGKLLEEAGKNWGSLKEKPGYQLISISKALLTLIEKFMGAGEIEAFFTKYCKKLKLTLKQPILKRLQELANAIEEEIQRCKSLSGEYNIRFLSHLYTNVLACIVTPVEKEFTHRDLKSEGWKIGKDRYRTPRKQQLDDSFKEIQPKKRGRVELDEEIKQKIVQEWIDNSRAAANLEVKDRSNGDKKPALRLIVPALQVALLSKLVKTRNNPEGVVSISTFNKYRPFWVKNPSLKDGLCHHCMKRRTLIKVIHRHLRRQNKP